MNGLKKKFPFKKEHFQLFYHPDCLLHDTGTEHPDTPERLSSILRGCSTLPAGLPVSFQTPPPADVSFLELAHDNAYLQRLEAACLQGATSFMTPDNPISPDTFKAVVAAGGCVLALAETLLQHGAGFALIRPPGHHAGRNHAEGFCFVNHVALAVEAIRQKDPGASFLVVDFDIHHGNGIDYFYSDDPKVFYFSLHGPPEHIYPHSGYIHETGRAAGTGYTRNVTVPLDSSGDQWLRLFTTNLRDVEKVIRPDYLLISAGFDAHREDPFGVINAEDHHFLSLVSQLKRVADEQCAGKVAIFLEGGYSAAVLERLVPEIITVFATTSHL